VELVREHINEKFTDDSDPITDMGIGEYINFRFLKVGDVFEFNKEYIK